MTHEDEVLLASIEALLDDPAYRDNPLRGALADLYQHHCQAQGRLAKLITISDHFQRHAREDELASRRRYQKALRRQEKLSRISDGFQQLIQEHNQALQQASTHDALTGLPNRRMINQRLREESETSQRYTLAMLDIDHFKQINDRYGHEIGDQVLVAIAQVIRQELRDYDLCARWGGEEFLLLLANTRIDEAQAIVDRLRSRLSRIPIVVGGNMLSITASAGLSEHRAGESLLDATLLRADHALLMAKRSGRNRTCTEVA